MFAGQTRRLWVQHVSAFDFTLGVGGRSEPCEWDTTYRFASVASATTHV